MRALEIFDADDDGRLAASLRDVLELLAPVAEPLTWTLRYLEAREGAVTSWPGGREALEHAASSRRNGLELSWPRLLAIAAELSDVVDARLDGWAAGTRPGESGAEVQLRVEVLDASLVRISARDRRVLALVQGRFRDVRDVELSEMA